MVLTKQKLLSRRQIIIYIMYIMSVPISTLGDQKSLKVPSTTCVKFAIYCTAANHVQASEHVSSDIVTF